MPDECGYSPIFAPCLPRQLRTPARHANARLRRPGVRSPSCGIAQIRYYKSVDTSHGRVEVREWWASVKARRVAPSSRACLPSPKRWPTPFARIEVVKTRWLGARYGISRAQMPQPQGQLGSDIGAPFAGSRPQQISDHHLPKNRDVLHNASDARRLRASSKRARFVSNRSTNSCVLPYSSR